MCREQVTFNFESPHCIGSTTDPPVVRSNSHQKRPESGENCIYGMSCSMCPVSQLVS